ncbi:3'-5' exonuclease [Lachnospiraceae bacterium HCP1S3_C3]|nr:3'-5' exonuclease [Lachnospiraceae bacterium]
MIDKYVALDIETTGFNPVNDKILEIGAVKVKNGRVVDTFSELINPGIPVPWRITEVTGIDDSMVRGCDNVSVVLRKFLKFCDEDVILGHNLNFDYSFLAEKSAEIGMKFSKYGLDTLTMAKKHLKNLESRKLDYLCAYYGIEDKEHHRAYNDAGVTVELYKKLADLYEKEKDSVFIPVKMQYKPKKASPITPRQKTYLTDLIRYHRLEFNENINELSKSEASRWIDKILSTHGRIF